MEEILNIRIFFLWKLNHRLQTIPRNVKKIIINLMMLNYSIILQFTMI